MINSISFFLFEKLQPNIQTPKFQFLIPGNETPKLIINGKGMAERIFTLFLSE